MEAAAQTVDRMGMLVSSSSALAIERPYAADVIGLLKASSTIFQLQFTCVDQP